VQQAIPLFRQSIDLAPQSQQAKQGLLNALLTLGGELLSQGKITDAITTYNEVTQLAPQNFEAYLGLARALLQQGDLLKALTAARHALHLAPNNGEALSLLQQMQRR
jgi:tetratricopeptide (TPR) repeat protein